ncbi:DUF3226 domain-containing protein [Prevotella denticola]|uniref:DUF3226 domain-containing protein n=1 Tax=Prevotella denticola TaxID=28129 RepID=UPI0002013055|nr:DUF3226 domain-containing protein [Prevotella denticola]AEA21244.1 hypothetical protein HMPREF9137_1946 [Prevotella denticola F0289]QUB89447.1 hypothetical protein J4860_07435 [Prevotella denticola]
MTYIFLEAGKPATSEAVFIKTLIENLGYNISSNKVEFVNGYKNLVNVIPTIKARCAEGGKVVIIFDADSLGNNGGYETRKKEIEEVLGENNAQAELFLFPNNEEDGDFETLLEHLIQKEKHTQMLDCYADYETCLGNDYVHPNLKGKIFTYISAMKMSSSKRRKLGNGEWMFDNAEYWSLESDYLKPLKEFLQQHCSKE